MKTMREKSNAGKCPQQVLEYLPLIINGTCPPDKRAEVGALLEKMPECAEEFEQFSTLSRLLKEEAKGIYVPSDTLFEEIMGRIEAAEEKASSPSDDGVSSFAARIARWFSPSTIRIATAFAILIIIFQFAIILNQSKRIETYHTLSEPVAATQGSITLNIIFSPEAHLKSIQAFLSRYHGQITGGPGASGVYTVSFPRQKNPQKFLHTLRKRKAIILFAELKN